jgi:hypothetical protein
MTIIELPDEQAAKLQTQAEARGMTILEWIAELTEHAPEQENHAGDQRPIWDLIVENMKDVPAEVMTAMPADGASEHDHYIYGWPKREA